MKKHFLGFTAVALIIFSVSTYADVQLKDAAPHLSTGTTVSHSLLKVAPKNDKEAEAISFLEQQLGPNMADPFITPQVLKKTQKLLDFFAKNNINLTLNKQKQVPEKVSTHYMMLQYHLYQELKKAGYPDTEYYFYSKMFAAVSDLPRLNDERKDINAITASPSQAPLTINNFNPFYPYNIDPYPYPSYYYYSPYSTFAPNQFMYPYVPYH